MSNRLRVTGMRLRGSTIAILVGIFFSLPGCGDTHDAHNDTYTCPMHPTVTADRPGACPVCGMDLVRKARPGEEITITEDLSSLMKSPNQAVVASIKTVRGEFKSVPMLLEATGIITYDTRNIYSIPARVAGRLEQVYLKYNYQPVRKGQKVAEIYSPELVTAQRELIFLLENDSHNTALIEASKNKLALLGLTRTQIDGVAERREPQNTFAIFSPYNGYVTTEGSAPPAASTMTPSGGGAGGGMDNMGGASTAPSPQALPGVDPGPPATVIRAGSYVSAGQTLFKIIDNSALRIELDVPGREAGAVSEGDQVNLMLGDSGRRTASVDFVQPVISDNNNFVKIRVYVTSTEGLQIGQLVKATIHLQSNEGLWIPRESVLDLGTRKVVFIKERDVLKPKSVTIGVRSGNLIEVTGGLASSDEIAANAHYLVDNESFVKPE